MTPVRTAARTAVVVGGGSGIGAAVADRYRSAGVDVVVWDRVGDADIRCDITDPDQVDAAVAATVGRIGAPGQVTVTAGIGHSGLLADVDAAEWDRVMAVNAKGVWLAMRGLVGTMTAGGQVGEGAAGGGAVDESRGDGGDGRGGGGTDGESAGGSIVVISSVSARLVDRTMGLYCASKAALDMVVRVAAREWAPAVRVNAVAPGVTDTPMLGPAPREGAWLTGVAGRTALGRLGRPGDIAEAVLAVHGMHWVTGQIIECDGGLSLHSPIDPAGGSRRDPGR